MTKKKTKVLLLGAHDSMMAGHIRSAYEQIKDHTDAVMVTLYGFYGKAPHCLWPINGKDLSLKEKIQLFKYSKIFYYLWAYLYSIFRLRCFPIVDKSRPEYCFDGFEFLPYSANDILRRCPKDFVPDIIMIGWSSRFISSKIIHDLYKKTKAKIVYSLVDQAPLTGGCHYPNECRGYLSGCNGCPALKHGKKLASKQMEYKEFWLKDIPLFVSGSPYDIRLALETKVFKYSNPIPGISMPMIEITSQKDAREKLNIPEDRFVVLIGATNLESVRKGFTYTVESINKLKNMIKSLFILAIGNSDSGLKHKFPNVELMELGFVDINKMVLAYCASDCFLSTTIADSGPQTVNYSAATGTPIVSFSVGIAQDLVLHKRTGYIANFKDADDLAEGLYYIYNLDRASYKKMCEECIDLIRAKSSKGGWREQLFGI